MNENARSLFMRETYRPVRCHTKQTGADRSPRPLLTGETEV
jgi:hypothetical protein